jgi:hypothetical protein
MKYKGPKSELIRSPKIKHVSQAPERERRSAPLEQIVKLEKEMSQVQTHYKEAESHYGADLLNLVVAKGYLTKLLANQAVQSFIQRHEPEILKHFELVVNTVSMEEAVQQRVASDQLNGGPEPQVPQKGEVPFAESELSEPDDL